MRLELDAILIHPLNGLVRVRISKMTDEGENVGYHSIGIAPETAIDDLEKILKDTNDFLFAKGLGELSDVEIIKEIVTTGKIAQLREVKSLEQKMLREAQQRIVDDGN